MVRRLDHLGWRVIHLIYEDFRQQRLGASELTSTDSIAGDPQSDSLDERRLAVAVSKVVGDVGNFAIPVLAVEEACPFES